MTKAQEADTVDEVIEQGGEQEGAEKPKRRGRPKGSGRKKKTEDVAGTNGVAEAQAEDAPDVEEKAPPKKRGRPKKQAPKAEPEESGDEEAGQAASGDDADSGDDAEDTKKERGSSRRGRGRSQRSRRQSLNYRDLQSKILPELHLLAKEVGLSDYRQMDKDDLSVAILERSAEGEGLKLVRGYLEISSDGYGFLQESLLQNNTRSVIVSAGLIKQFKLRTGDMILGKSRKPRDNERYGTLIRVEAVNGVDPFQAAKRPRFDDLVPTFPEERIQLETTQNEVAARVIDLLAPIGRGQRGLIVAPPKAGKTTLLKKDCQLRGHQRARHHRDRPLSRRAPRRGHGLPRVGLGRRSDRQYLRRAADESHPRGGICARTLSPHRRRGRARDDPLLDSITSAWRGRTTSSRRPQVARSRAVWTPRRCTGLSAF